MINSVISRGWQEIRKSKVKRKSIKKAVKLADKNVELRLDLGCGSLKKIGFIGLDLSPDADIEWDIRWGIPFKDNCVLEIRSDHFFEHLELPTVVETLRECRRVLVPGGVLNFTVPHFDPYFIAYTQKDFNFLKEKIYDVPLEQEQLYNTCFDRISWLLYRSGEHKSFFDKESIIAKVKLAGFVNSTTREFDETRDTNPRFSSIYVMAIK